MSYLNLNNLSLTLGIPLFSGLNLTINKGDRIGLVAANGRGKTSLLKLLAGDLEASGGDITRQRGLRIGHVEQNVAQADLGLTLIEMVLGALDEEQAEMESWRVDIVLDDLSVPEAFRGLRVGDLSGGWQRVGLLARAWVSEPDLLLLDEPTNHLDLNRIGILQNWLSSVARAVPILVASHDRAFLDAVTNRTLFLREAASPVFALPFTPARIALAEADAADERRHSNDIKQANQLRRQAAKLKNIGINSGSDLLITKTKQLKDRAERLEAAAKPAHVDRSAGAIKLGNSGTHAKALVLFDNAEITTPDGRVLFNTGKVWINRGDRVVLLGGNGTGKTQMVRALAAALEGGSGAIKAVPSVVSGVSDQSLSQLDAYKRPIDAITHQFDVGDARARAFLAGAGMSIDLQSSPISALSGGQKARLAMLILRLTHPNFYLLDEPTNHLDIEGQETLEDELCASEASCLLVSHDRTFVRQVGNRFWQIVRKKLVEVEDAETFFLQALEG